MLCFIIAVQRYGGKKCSKEKPFGRKLSTGLFTKRSYKMSQDPAT